MKSSKKTSGAKRGKGSAVRRAMVELRRLALSYPETREDFPWGESALKVRGRTFVFMSLGDGGLRITTKLPQSGAVALMLPFAEPTGYGLGRSGWVTAQFGSGDEVPVEVLRRWIDESYRAVAPKSVVRKLPPPGA